MRYFFRREFRGGESILMRIVLPQFSTGGSGSLLTCYLTEKPSADKAEDRTDQRTEHGKPEGDVGNQRAMCLCICAHLFC